MNILLTWTDLNQETINLFLTQIILWRDESAYKLMNVFEYKPNWLGEGDLLWYGLKGWT